MGGLLGAIWVAMLLIPFAAWYAVNQFDEPLHPHLKNPMDWHPPEGFLEDKSNGFFTMLGMDAPGSEDAYLSGKQIFKADFEQFKQLSDRELPLANNGNNKPTSRYRGREHLCSSRKTNCVDYYLHHRNEVLALLRDNSVIQQRYQEILHAPHYQDEMISIGEHVPPYPLFVDAHLADQACAVIEVALGNRQTGVVRLAENMRLVRKLLASSTSMIARMYMLKALRSDTRILGELLFRYPELAHQPSIDGLLSPIDTPAFSWRKPYEVENRMARQLLQVLRRAKIEGRDDAALKVLLPNATENLLDDLLEESKILTESPAHKLDTAVARYNEKFNALLGYAVVDKMLYLRNPEGKIIVLTAAPFQGVFIDGLETQYDTEGYMRLVALQRKLIVEQVPYSQVGEAVRMADVRYRDPWTLKPMEWVQETGQIRFHGRQKQRVYYVQMPHDLKVR